MEYIHTQAEDWGYELTEGILEVEGRKIFYLISEIKYEFIVGCDRSCIDPSQATTFYVIGEVVKWKYKSREEGIISEIEPIKNDQNKIKKFFENNFNTAKIYFGHNA